MDGMVRFGRALAVLLVCAAGCEVLVSGQITDVRCQAEGAVGPPACPDGYACTAGRCVSTALGVPCNADSDCGAGQLCLDPRVWDAAGAGVPDGGAADAGRADGGAHALGDAGVVLPSSGQKRCSRTCCTSSDCDPDSQFVCAIASAAGGGFCRAAAEVGRAVGGKGEAMAPCASDGECRSGLCAGQRCADTCCSDTSCAAGAQGVAACRFGAAPVAGEPVGFWCAPPMMGKAPVYTPCKSASECTSGLCGPFGSTGSSACLPPCCSSVDCPSLGSQNVQCITLPPGPNGGVRACGALGDGTGGASNGILCNSAADCRGGMCIDHRCSDTCCSDASCGDPASLVCRPVNITGGWPLRCEPK